MSGGAPTPARFRPPVKKVQQDDQNKDAVGEKCYSCTVRSTHIQHYAVRDFATPNFSVVVPADWLVRVVMMMMMMVMIIM